jgi:hypothetical protein
MDLVADELNYETKISNHSTINFRDLAPQDQTSVVLSNTGSTGPSEFIIAPVVFNPAKTRLEFTLTVGAPTAGAGSVNVIAGNLLRSISRLVCYDSGTNALLVDINHFDKYTDMMEYAISKEELRKRPFVKNQLGLKATLADARKVSLEDRQRDNTMTLDESTLYGRASDGLGAEAGGVVEVGDAEIDAPCFLYEGGDNAQVVVDVSIPLSALKGTILAQNNNIYSPTNLVIQLYWNATNQFASSPVSANIGTAVGVAVSSATITNLNLSLAVESNLAITSKVISKVMSEGISFNAPYPSIIKHTTSNSESHAFTSQLTRAYGNRILCLITAKYGKTAFKIGERGLGDMSRYQTTLNSIPIKYPKGFDTTKSEHYTLGNLPYIQKSCIQSRTLYNQRFVHIDSFFGEKPLCDVDFNDVDGLDVSAQSSLFGWEATMATAEQVDYYIVVLGHKVISFTGMGATIQ